MITKGEQTMATHSTRPACWRGGPTPDRGGRGWAPWPRSPIRPRVPSINGSISERGNAGPRSVGSTPGSGPGSSTSTRSCPMGTCCHYAGYVTSATPTTGASLSTGPATTTTKTPGCPPAYPPDPPKTPSTPPAASTSATPPPGPEPPTNFEASPLVAESHELDEALARTTK